MKSPLPSKANFLTTIIATALLTAISSVGSAANDSCTNLDNGTSLLKCYQSEFKRKASANEDRARTIITRAKDHVEKSTETEANTTRYLDLISKVNQAVISSRKSASLDCARMAARIRHHDTSAIAAVNCRSGYEAQLEKQLRQFQARLEVLNTGSHSSNED